MSNVDHVIFYIILCKVSLNWGPTEEFFWFVFAFSICSAITKGLGSKSQQYLVTMFFFYITTPSPELFGPINGTAVV